VFYDNDWKDHTYFISSQETGFELTLLQKLDVELLIGQLSYKQKATIYNLFNGYDDTKKEIAKRKKNSESSDACRYASRLNDRQCKNNLAACTSTLNYS
jgi:23S rRNA maturation mini-RNase III